MSGGRELTDQEAAELVAAIDGTDTDVKDALTKALSVVLGVGGSSDWSGLIMSAAVVANWPERRREMVLVGDRPMLEDLLLELQEVRRLEQKLASPGDVPTMDLISRVPPKQTSVEDQREAASAMEVAIRAVGMRDAKTVRAAVRKAEELDVTKRFAYSAPLLDLVADDLERGEDPSETLLHRLIDALGAGPLSALVELVARVDPPAEEETHW